MKHTPGPWTVDRMLIPPRAKDRRYGFVVNGPDTSKDDLPVRICDLRVPAGVWGFSEGRANASLIAESPAMLAALKLAVRYLEHPDVQAIPFALSASVLLEQALAIIARVEGDGLYQGQMSK
jgi:hypothetical protein